jgi:hypothetical protein
MTEQKEPPRPHGDPLQREIVESNPAQRQSDAPDDVVGQGASEEATAGTRSTTNGIPALDEDEGKQRRKLYEGGAELVSKID